MFSIATMHRKRWNDHRPMGLLSRIVPWAVASLFSLLLAWPVWGNDVRVVLANDFLASNRLNDDLYTSALIIDFDRGKNRILFGENIFTDSDNGLRFDETWLALERPLLHRGLWRSWVEVGVVHVGEGLLGESAQNAVHRLIGDEEVHLSYLDVDRYHPTFRLRFERDLPRWRRMDLAVTADVYGAVDFKQHAEVSVQGRWPRFHNATFFGELGARYSASQLDALKARTAELGPTWEAGVMLHEKISLAWNYNHFGTRSQHFNVVYHVPWKKDRRQGRGRS